MLGECKYGRQVGTDELARLQRIRDMLASTFDVTQTRLLLVSGRGFTPALRRAARDPSVVLVDTERLYQGT